VTKATFSFNSCLQFYTAFTRGTRGEFIPICDIQSQSANQALADFKDLYGNRYGPVIVIPATAGFEDAVLVKEQP